MRARFPCLYCADPGYIMHFYMVISLMYINGDIKKNYYRSCHVKWIYLSYRDPLCKNTRPDIIYIDVGYGGALGECYYIWAFKTKSKIFS